MLKIKNNIIMLAYNYISNLAIDYSYYACMST